MAPGVSRATVTRATGDELHTGMLRIGRGGRAYGREIRERVQYDLREGVLSQSNKEMVERAALALTLALLSALLLLLLLRRYAHSHTPPLRGRPPPLLGTACGARVVPRGGADGCLLVPFRLGAYESSFVLDTGYAGALVLNARLLGASGTTDEEALRTLLAPRGFRFGGVRE